MTAEYLGHAEPGSAEWHNMRATGIGGSEIAAVLGLSPYESRFSLWHRKQGLADPQPENSAMWSGKHLEPAVAGMFVEQHPMLYVVPGCTWRSTTYPWQIANPDRLIERPDGRTEVLEIKTARTPDGWGEPGTDEIPMHYRCQVLWYLDVLMLDRARVVVLFSGQDYAEYVVEYDQAEVDTLRKAGEMFWRSITDGERPDIDAHTATYQVIREQHPDIDGADVTVDDLIADTYRGAVVEQRKTEAAKRYAISQLLDAMGTARRAVDKDGVPIATRIPRKNRAPVLRPAATKE